MFGKYLSKAHTRLMINGYLVLFLFEIRSIHVQIESWLNEVRVGNTIEIDWETVNENKKNKRTMLKYVN